VVFTIYARCKIELRCQLERQFKVQGSRFNVRLPATRNAEPGTSSEHEIR
jgi:hypothetical protein